MREDWIAGARWRGSFRVEAVGSGGLGRSPFGEVGKREERKVVSSRRWMW